MGCAAAPTPQDLGFSDRPRAPVYCRCAPDRGQATLLRPSARIKYARRRKSASAEGVGALRGYESSDGLRSGPNTSGPWFLGHTACTGLLPLRARSRASLAPTACGQNQKLCGQASQTACGQNQKRAAPGIRFCRRRRSSSRLREQRWAAQRPQHLRTLVCSDTPRAPVYCRCAPDRGQASLLRPSARIKSSAGKPRKRPAARIKSARRRKSACAEGVGAFRGTCSVNIAPRKVRRLWVAVKGCAYAVCGDAGR